MITLLGLITVILIIVILFQISNASDMAMAIRGEERTTAANSQLHGTLFMAFLVFAMIAAFGSTWYYKDLFLPPPASEHGAGLRTMFQWTLVATVPVFVATHIALFWFAYKYRGQKGKLAYYYPDNHKLEAIWTLIPAVVMVVLVFFGLVSWAKITSPAPKEAIIIEATGQQFKWTIRYSGKDNALGMKSVEKINSDNGMGIIWSDAHSKDDFVYDTLKLPLNKPVLIKINALDVLHSFFLPHFRVKMDAVPGIPTQFWFTATKTTAEARKEYKNPNFNYELACAEICGSSHFNMRKVVVVEEAEKFDKWFAAQKPMYEDLTEEQKNGAPKEEHKEEHGSHDEKREGAEHKQTSSIN